MVRFHYLLALLLFSLIFKWRRLNQTMFSDNKLSHVDFSMCPKLYLITIFYENKKGGKPAFA